MSNYPTQSSSVDLYIEPLVINLSLRNFIGVTYVWLDREFSEIQGSNAEAGMVSCEAGLSAYSQSAMKRIDFTFTLIVLSL